MHAKHLLIDNETMSKSKGNFFTIPDIVARGHRPEAIRYLLCRAHYRKPLNFTFEGLQQAAAALERVHGARFAARRDGWRWARGAAAVRRGRARAGRSTTRSRDDLNTPEALAAVHGLVGDANALLAEGALTRAGAARVCDEIAAMDGVFGVLLPAGRG